MQKQDLEKMVILNDCKEVVVFFPHQAAYNHIERSEVVRGIVPKNGIVEVANTYGRECYEDEDHKVFIDGEDLINTLEVITKQKVGKCIITVYAKRMVLVTITEKGEIIHHALDF